MAHEPQNKNVKLLYYSFVEFCVDICSFLKVNVARSLYNRLLNTSSIFYFLCLNYNATGADIPLYKVALLSVHIFRYKKINLQTLNLHQLKMSLI